MASFAGQMRPTPEVFSKQRRTGIFPFGRGSLRRVADAMENRRDNRQSASHTIDVRKTLSGRGSGVV